MPISRHVVFYATIQYYLYRLPHYIFLVVFKLVNKNFWTQDTSIERQQSKTLKKVYLLQSEIILTVYKIYLYFHFIITKKVYNNSNYKSLKVFFRQWLYLRDRNIFQVPVSSFFSFLGLQRN